MTQTIPTRTMTRSGRPAMQRAAAEICVLGAGMSGVSAALEADADSHALSAIRVMGTCIAMGAAAAHALHLAGSSSIASVDMRALQRSLYDNLERRD